MRRYEPEVRETMVQRMMSPGNLCIATLARETGISRGTLQYWRKQAKATTHEGTGANQVRE
jgi:transposase-like protein